VVAPFRNVEIIFTIALANILTAGCSRGPRGISATTVGDDGRLHDWRKELAGVKRVPALLSSRPLKERALIVGGERPLAQGKGERSEPELRSPFLTAAVGTFGAHLNVCRLISSAGKELLSRSPFLTPG